MNGALFDILFRWSRVAVTIVAISGCLGLNREVAADSPEAGAPAAPPSAESTVPPVADSTLEPSPATMDEGENAPAEVSDGAPAASSPTSSGDAFGIHFDSDRPVSIRSDELESSKVNGTRKLVFTKNVVVEQDDLTIRSRRLEAYYPPDASQPSRMIASGRVSLTNGEYDARCDEATYERVADTLTCRGNAEMREGDDCVAGKWILFDLEADTVKVGGGATVVLGGENEGRGSGVCL